MNKKWEVFMILLCRNAAWGKISFLLILQVSPQMTLRFLMKSKPKALSVIGLYPIDSAIATIMVQLGNKLPGIGKQHTVESGKINLFFRHPTAERETWGGMLMASVIADAGATQGPTWGHTRRGLSF